MKVFELVSFLNQIAPYSYQESYDNSGLLVGDSNAEVSGVLVSLDCVETVIDEAISLGYNTIVSHHPIVFKGLKRITGANYIERTVQKAIKNDINLISIHTNLDNVSHGVNKIICDKLNLTNTKVLQPKESTFVKLSVYVPKTHLDVVRSAISEAGAGQIGDYEACTFSVSGTGQFRPLDSANPFIGKAGELESVEEMKIEVTVPQPNLTRVLSAMRKSHPYEEIAHDVVALENRNDRVGSGMVGELENPMKTEAFLRQIKTTFNAGVVRFTDPHKKEVQRIAVCGGSGSFLLGAAKKAKADVFITADFKYHEFFDAENQIIIADIGHFESEQYTSHWLVSEMQKKFTNFAVRLTNLDTNPINYL